MIFESPGMDRISQLRELWKEAFGDTDAFLDGFFETGFSPRRCRCIVEGGRVVSALYWFEGTLGSCRYAYLYAVATAKVKRGQGLFSALLEDVKQVLTAEGYDGILLLPETESLARMYEKLGFRCCTAVDTWHVRAEKVRSLALAGSHLPRQREASPVRQISAAAYAALRRSRLPAGAVLQEGDWLPFLDTQYRFFEGEDFLAAGQSYEGKFYAQEFLGDRACMEGLLCALDVTEGVFRTPGKGRSFAYLLKLQPECLEPTYFAIAMD